MKSAEWDTIHSDQATLRLTQPRLDWFFHNYFPKNKGVAAMGDSGKKDKGKKEQKKKPEHNLKEKRKLKNEKKQKGKFMPG